MRMTMSDSARLSCSSHAPYCGAPTSLSDFKVPLNLPACPGCAVQRDLSRRRRPSASAEDRAEFSPRALAAAQIGERCGILDRAEFSPEDFIIIGFRQPAGCASPPLLFLWRTLARVRRRRCCGSRSVAADPRKIHLSYNCILLIRDPHPHSARGHRGVHILEPLAACGKYPDLRHGNMAQQGKRGT